MNKINAFAEGHFIATVMIVVALNVIFGWWLYEAVFAKL